MIETAETKDSGRSAALVEIPKWAMCPKCKVYHRVGEPCRCKP